MVADAPWDGLALSGLSVGLGQTATGRRVFSLYYSTSNQGGYAAAFEATQWSRSPINPIFVSAVSRADFAEPMRVADVLLHARNSQADRKVRALGAARFGAALPEANQ